MLPAILTEFTIGAVIGLGAQMLFEAVQVAGQTMGLQMGLSLATVFDPNSTADSPVMPVFVQMLATLMFLAVNAHVFLLRAVTNSYEWLPPGTELKWATLGDWGSRAMAGALSGAVQLAAPVVLATICVDLVLGFIGKASPQVPVLLVGISLKAVIALVVLFAVLRYWPDLIASHFEAALSASERVLHMMR
jgi:flagellar biosynthetic protein FliR